MLIAVSESGKLAHFRCAKKRKWKRKSRAKVKIVREIAPVSRPVKIVKAAR